MRLRKLKTCKYGEVWVLDTQGRCQEGYVFLDVVKVREPLSINPGIEINLTLGLRAVKQALTMIEAERAKIGLTTLPW